MEVKFEIPEDKVIHFTENAKKRLIDEAQKYTLDIVNESERTEELLREDGASSEITNSTVIQAVRRNHTVRKKKTKIIVLRIIAEVFLFAAGIMFLPDSFVTPQKEFNIVYFSIFAIVTLAALTLTIISHFVGGE